MKDEELSERGRMHAYFGRYLVVDLATGSAVARPLPEAEARAFVGGVGLASRWLYRHAPAGVPPLGPQNPLIFASCPLVDTGVTTTSKAAVAARSPLTHFIGESLISSRFAVALKRTGWDGLVLTGACPELSILVVDGGAVRVVPAPGLAGMTTSEAERAVCERLGPGFEAATIGPAGERLVRYATISHDGRHAGRTGLGAVMGAKRLKAIAVRGEHRVSVADPEGLRREADRLRARSLGPETAKYRLAGTAANLLTFDRLGILPARNFRATGFAAAEQLTGEALAGARPRERSGCFACTIGCDYRYLPADGGAAVRLEYETLFALGPLLGIEDAETLLQAARLCDELGMDTLSAGGTLAWAMECRERGLLAGGAADDPAPSFGDGDALLAMLPRIAAREGLGDLLAEGSRAAAARLGSGSEAWAMHVKGLELPGYEPRALRSLALGLAVGARGACHNRSGGYDRDLAARAGAAPPPSPAEAAVESEDRAAVIDSLVLCKFLRRCLDDFYGDAARLLAMATGWDVAAGELRRAGSRIVTLKRLYNQREGATRADDTLPPRLLSEPLAAGSLTRGELDALLDEYYAARGWNADGTVPDPVARRILGE